MTNNTGAYYIGIDSGGTKCEILIVSKDKKILSDKSYKGVHYSVAGVENYSETVTDFIDDSLSIAGLGLKNCMGICLGIAGAREKKDRIKLKEAFTKNLRFKNISVTTDAMTALYGAFGGKDGIILISGTGSVLYGFSKGVITRVGGWGRIIGDEGSGYWIGRRALILIANEYDLRKIKNKNSGLSEKLEKAFGIKKENINEKVFNADFEIQKIAPIVIECSKKCAMSKKIIDEAVEGLMDHIRTYLKIANIKKQMKIAFIGSIIENKNNLSDKLKSELKKIKTIEVVIKQHSSAYGAVLLTQENPEIMRKI
ncbi:MAG: BadF/BadG/BcrA/BcrD ATPase family protein [Ignavibacteria bacterium]